MGSGTEADEDIDSFQGVIMHVTDSMLQPKDELRIILY